MKTRSCLIALGATLILQACSHDNVVEPNQLSSMPAVKRSLMGGMSANLPILFPTGLTFDGQYFWLSTGYGWRYTYKIDTNLVVVDSIMSLGNPRDVVFDNTDSLFISDMDGTVRKQARGGGFGPSFALPWRGGGIAMGSNGWVFIANIDADSILITDRAGIHLGRFALPVRAEAMVLDPQMQELWILSPFSSSIYQILSTAWAVARECSSPFNPGPYGLGGITMVGPYLVIAEPKGGDPWAGTTLHVLERSALVCNPPLP